MLRRFLSILCVIFVLGTSLAFGASAAGSTFDSDLYPVNSFVDLLGFQHDYFFIFGDYKGVIIEFKYKPIHSLTLDLTNSDLEYTFVSTSDSATLDIIYRDLKDGAILANSSVSVSGQFVSSYNTFFNSLTSSKLLSYPFSDFYFYSLSVDYFYFFNSSSNFYEGVVTWEEQSDSYLISSLSEPVFDGTNYWIVFQGANSGTLMQFYFDLATAGEIAPGASFDFTLEVTDTGRYRVAVFNPFKSPSSFYMYFSLYELSNGWYLGSSHRFISNPIGWTYANLNASVLTMPKVKCYGLGFENDYSFSVSLPNVLWNYDELLTQAITAQTLYIYTQLLQINQGLDDVEDILIDSLSELNFTLEQIYDILDRVYNAEPETFEHPSSDAVNEYLQDESAIYEVLPTGMVDNIDSALGSPDTVFEGNGAFGLIRSLMQGLAFNNSKINGLILFSLAMGIAVLILGRRLNS